MSTQEQNSLFAEQMVSNLIDLGIRYFAISPGSRSTPLTSAIARNSKAISYVFHDERSAAFFVLGIGKSGQLGAMITTSGTAIANAFPAVLEASNTHVPMLLISADRPPELRNSGANQTMDQVKLFGENVRYFIDFPSPNHSFNPKHLASTISFGVSKCFGSNAGPVHFNCMFREPLEPFELEDKRFPKPHFYSHPKQTISKFEKEQLKTIASRAKRPLLVIGAIESLSERYKAYFLTTKLDWTVIVDVSSGLSFLDYKNKLPFTEILIKQNQYLPKPDLIIQLGKGLSTKQYENWVRELNCEHIIIDYRSSRHDPGHSCTRRIQASFDSIDFLCELEPPDLSWLRNIQKQLQNISFSEEFISEITIAHKLPSWLPLGSQLFIGNSMPIRDLNNFASPAKGLFSTSNRGVSGIDGIISSAAGWGVGNQKHTFLLIGDISFMHDIGVLFSLQALAISLTIILINNSGGGIFSFLPISKQKDIFETYFATSHQFRLWKIAEEMGISAKKISSLEELQKEVQNPEKGISFLEVFTNREQNIQEHQDIKASIIKELEELS